MPTKWTRTLPAVAVATSALALVLTGCTAPTGNTSDSAGDSPTGSDVVKVSLEEMYEGGDQLPPTDGPPPAKDKSIWMISCGMASPSCAQVYAAAEDAITEIGWDYHFADGKLGVGGGYETAIRTALASDPDAIVIHGISCQDIQLPLQEAKNQGVPVIGVEGADCAETGGDQLFTVPHIYNESTSSTLDFWKDFGRRSAWYIIEKTDGQARVIAKDGPDPLEGAIAEGFAEEMEKCDECEIVETLDYPGTAMVPNGPWIQALRSALVTRQDVNAVFMPWDYMMSTLGGAQAVAETGREILVAGGQGDVSTSALIHDESVEGYTGAADRDFAAWSAVDNLNRYFNGENAAPQGVGWTAVDLEHDEYLPAAGETFVSPVDFKSAYRESWGVGS